MKLVVEFDGRLGDAAIGFIGRLSYSAGGSPSDRAAFTTYALQRIRALTVKGTAALIRTRPSSTRPHLNPQHCLLCHMGLY